MTRTPVIAITVGEPAGIGPEISIRGAWECRKNVIPVLIGKIGAFILSGRDLCYRLPVETACGSGQAQSSKWNYRSELARYRY